MSLLDLRSLWERLPVIITPATAGLTLTTFAPTVSTPRLITPAKATLVLTTSAPVVTISLGKPLRVGGWPTPGVKGHPIPPPPLRHPPTLPVAPYWPVPNYPLEPDDIAWLAAYADRVLTTEEFMALLTGE